jgi:hypothetical protein
MLLGTLVCMAAMLLLGFTRPVASLFTGWRTSAVGPFGYPSFFTETILEQPFNYIARHSINLLN